MKVKKILAMILAVCLIFVGGIGTISVSAQNLSDTATGTTPDRASPVFSSVSPYISSTSCSFTAFLNQTYTGTVTAYVQKDTTGNGNWVNNTTICSGDSFNSAVINKSTSCSLGSGTYRISVTVTISGVDYTLNTGSTKI